MNEQELRGRLLALIAPRFKNCKVDIVNIYQQNTTHGKATFSFTAKDSPAVGVALRFYFNESGGIELSYLDDFIDTVTSKLGKGWFLVRD